MATSFSDPIATIFPLEMAIVSLHGFAVFDVKILAFLTTMSASTGGGAAAFAGRAVSASADIAEKNNKDFFIPNFIRSLHSGCSQPHLRPWKHFFPFIAKQLSPRRSAFQTTPQIDSIPFIRKIPRSATNYTQEEYMELRHLRYFVAVAEELHFSRAAKRLNISQPPLSAQIAGLEASLGFKLLDRDKRNVALTKAGEMFFHRARTILSSAEDAAAEARRISRGYEGKLTIGYMSAIMLMRVTDYLKDFHAISPTAEIGLRQMRSHEQYLAVMNGDIDVGLVDIEMGSMASPANAVELNVDRALHEPLVLCVSRDHPLAGRDSVSMRELADTSFLTLTRQAFPSFFDTFLQLCQGAGFKPHIVQQVESMPAAVALATAGYGAALVPELSTRSAQSAGAAFIPLDEDAFVDIYLISRSANPTPLIERLRSIVRRQSA
ncbi:MAG TPA: LysR substrate-binding domain-containing protein [Novosphingobium sp.]|nr:LysR substrate-binding domain-containing protein [Novosphingobium sp.]